jgi:tetratricopeptide (TPR) repeat protein
LADHLKLLLRLFGQPAEAMGAILDRGSLLFASITVVAVTFAVQAGPVPARFPFYAPLFVLAAGYVPGLLLLATLIGHLGALGMVFRRDYSPLLTCTAMAWSAANLPLVLAGWTAPGTAFLVVAALAYLYFAVLMFFAVRTVFGLGNGAAGAVVALSWVPLIAFALLWGPLGFLFRILASPFFLFYLIYYLGSEFRGLGDGLRSGQNYRRMLEAAAVNPHDGEAQYQLGLIHQQRRQYSEAIRRFQAAVAIDRTETDAHFQLGRIANEQGRYQDALSHLEAAQRLDEKHSMSEVHRELGSVYISLGRLEEARRELALYTERREYDPEGLFHYGHVLELTGNATAAKELYERAVEAARTAPRYRRRFTAKWSRLAQKHLSKL